MARAASAGGRAAAIDDALPQYFYIYIDMPVCTYSSHMCTHDPFFRDVRRRERRFLCPRGGGARTRPFFIAHLTLSHTTCTPRTKKMTPDPPTRSRTKQPHRPAVSRCQLSHLSQKPVLATVKFVYARHEITCSFVAHRVVAWAKKAQSSTNTLHRRQSELHVPSDLPHISSLRSGTCSKPFWEGELRPMAAFPAFLSSAGVT